MSNPLLDTDTLPDFAQISAEHVVPAVEQTIAGNRQTIRELLAGAGRGWDDFFAVLEAQDDRLSSILSPVRHLNSVRNTPEIREAWEAVLPMVSEYFTELRQNPELFAAYDQFACSAEFEALDTAGKKAIENAIRDFRLAGVDLPEDDKRRFAEIDKRLSELSTRFSNNVLDATNAWARVVTDASDLPGLPATALALAQQTAEQRGEAGYMFTLDFPSYGPVMSYCENRELREEMYRAFATRASDQDEGEWDNSEVMQEILALRREQAELLGFANYAEYSLATKMARTTSEVLDFLETLASKARPRAEEEFAELARFAEAEFGVKELAPWDVPFYSEKLKQQSFAISAEEVRPYFPVPRVFEGMFEVVRRLFDLEITTASGVSTWHDDVTVHDIHRNGELVARFYLDIYARQGKRGGAWMDDCRTRRRRADGTLQLPVAYLTCNFTPPVGGSPSLLTHNEVVTLFHEFGHGLHHMLTQVECAPVSGIAGVAWDAVELPSQFMENWCWEPEALSFLSGHHETGEPLPAALLDRLLAAKNFQSAMMMVRQLEFALFDFRLHVEFDPDESGQVQRVLDEVRSSVAVIQPPSWHRFQHAFSHIFGGGYAAGYYSYKWAEVLSADAFSRFTAEGVFNRQTGEQFLTSVLEQGGSVDAMDMFVAFMGREPELDALLRQDGIS